mgnify:CR=1 FL=1
MYLGFRTRNFTGTYCGQLLYAVREQLANRSLPPFFDLQVQEAGGVVTDGAGQEVDFAVSWCL